jgi:NADH dehydrogenase
MMKIAITGASGFVGRHLARQLASEGHELVLLARGVDRRDPTAIDIPSARFVPAALCDPGAIEQALAGCYAVAHCAGINREIGRQTFQTVHIAGTRHVVEAARRVGVKKIALMSFLRARPNCGSPYHESKWAAEEIIRNSGLDYTIVKAGMVYGRGDHMLDHLSHSLHTLPFFATVGFNEKPIRPLAIDDLVRILRAALVDARLNRQTVAVTGAEQLNLSEAARRVAGATSRRILILPAPVWFHYVLAQIFEFSMTIPLVAKAQVRILSEGVVEPATSCDPLPPDLTPTRKFAEEQIRQGLPEPGPFRLADLRCCASYGK